MNDQWFSVALSAFILWTSLMLAFGPQSALILKQGIRKQGLVAVLAVVIISDFFLAALGISGVSAMVDRAPWLVTGLRWGGVVYLLWFAYTCFRDGLAPKTVTAADVEPTPPALTAENEDPNEPLLPRTISYGNSAGTAVAVADAPTQQQTATMSLVRSARGPAFAAFVMTWFNPNAYVDSILLGSLSIHHPGMETAIFVGAMCGTCLWFPSFGFAAHKLSGQLSKPHIWARLNLAIGVIMVLMALRLAISG